MDQSITDWLDRLLASAKGMADEVEYLFVQQHELTHDMSHDQHSHEQSQNFALMLTWIRNSQLSRFSWVTHSWQQLQAHIDLQDCRRSVSRPELATFSLTREPLPDTNPDNGLARCPSAMAYEQCLPHVKAIASTYIHHDRSLAFIMRQAHYHYANSHEVRGSWCGQENRLSYSIADSTSQQVKRGLLVLSNDTSHTLQYIEDTGHWFDQQRLPQNFIRGGISPVLLSPKVVQMLCSLLWNSAKLGTPWPERMAQALPLSLTLEEQPSYPNSLRAMPFDHEGVVTTAKTLCQGGKRTATLSDLATASRFNSPSSGNGFRCGVFLEALSDNTPTVQPSFLNVRPGVRRRHDIFSEVDDFIFLNQIYLPADRFQDLLMRQTMVTFSGIRITHGQPASHIIAKNYARRPLISAFPESYGSLLDPSSEILATGETLATGWYPYIFLPQMRWGDF